MNNQLANLLYLPADKESVVASLAVFVDVKAFFLDASVAAYAVCVLDDCEEHECHGEAESAHSESSDELCADVYLRAVDGGVAEDAGEHCSEQAAYAVNRYGADGVVNLQLLVDSLQRSTSLWRPRSLSPQQPRCQHSRIRQ